MREEGGGDAMQFVVIKVQVETAVGARWFGLRFLMFYTMNVERILHLATDKWVMAAASIKSTNKQTV